MSIKVVIVKPNEEPKVEQIEDDLEVMQHIVGGLIQELPISEDAAIICNEEGKLYGLPMNRPVFDQDGRLFDVIVGTFFVAGISDMSESFLSLSDEQIRRYIKQFAL